MDPFEQWSLQIEGGAFAVNSKRQVVFWNRACEQLLGIPARAALGQPCFKVIRANEASGRRFCGKRCTLAGLARGGAAPRPVPLWFSATDGAPQPLSVSVFLIPSDQQGLWHVMHVLKGGAKAKCAPPADRPAPGGDARALTRRETEVIGLLARGFCTTEIARRLFVSPVTVRNHVQHLTAKLGLHSQLEAVAYAYRHGLAPRDSPLGRSPFPAAGVAA